MESVLLALALATCVDNNSKCTIEEGVEGTKTLVTACGLAPETGGRPITFEVVAKGTEYVIVLEPKCLGV